MKISIIIPVYNEADTLRDCLDAISLMKIKPLEVIVVDNNSYDDTFDIAESYSFVKAVKEQKQGVVYARTKGFNLAHGDIIARIDADTILPADWIKNLKKIFKDDTLAATSGVADYYNVAYSNIFNAIDIHFRRKLAKELEGKMYLWGANMAIRKDAWNKVKAKLCFEKNIHEDYDLAIHLQELGMKVSFDERITAKVSSRRIDTNFVSFIKYVWKSPSTYARHNQKVYLNMMPVVATCIIGYLPGRILYRGYDPIKEAFSINKLLEPNKELSRIDPTVNVA